jgi:hypothetical protein
VDPRRTQAELQLEWSVFRYRAYLNARGQGCRMVYFQTKNPNLVKFWSVLQWKILVCFMTIWSILLLLEIIYGQLVYFVVIKYIFPRVGILYQVESGNSAEGSFLKSHISASLCLRGV